MHKSLIASTFVTSPFYHLVEIRTFRWGRVIATEQEGVYCLIMKENDSPQHILYEYHDWNEFEADVERVRRFPGESDGNAGVPANIGPTPPVLTAQETRPLPPSHEKPI